MIVFSEAESLIFNLKFGRYEGTLPNPQVLREQILSDKYDFVRLKIVNPDEQLFATLNKIGIPYHLLDIHRLYNLDLNSYTVPAPVIPEMEFKEVTASSSLEMKKVIVNTYSESPMGYFRNEIIEKYFPIPLQVQNFADYISNNFIERTNPGKRGWLVTLNNTVIGCIATEFKRQHSYTPYIGLLPEYRKKHLFTNMAYFVQRTLKQAGCRYASGSARLHNLASQINFERVGQKFTSHDYVFMLMPLLSEVP